MTAPKRLWADIPISERMDETDLAGCNGARDPAWLKAQIKMLRKPKCPAAVEWNTTPPILWFPCRYKTYAGEEFCWRHGGTTRKQRAARRAGWRRIFIWRKR